MVFEYRLERLMKLNESEKQQLENHYQVLYSKLEEIAEKLIELMKKKETLTLALHKETQEKLSASTIHERLMYIQTLEKRIFAEQKVYYELTERVETLKQALKEKSIEVKKHERLKEHAYHQHVLFEKKHELKKMDEQAQLIRSFRGQASQGFEH